MLVIWCTGTLRHFIRPALREINYCCRYVIPEKEEKIMKITKTNKNYSQKWKEEYLAFVCSFDFLKPVWNGRVTHRHPHCSYPSIYLSAWGWPGPRPPTADTHTHTPHTPTLLLSIYLSICLRLAKAQAAHSWHPHTHNTRTHPHCSCPSIYLPEVGQGPGCP